MSDPVTDPLMERMRAADPETFAARPTDAEIDMALSQVLLESAHRPSWARRLAVAGRRPGQRTAAGLALAGATIAVILGVVLATSGSRPAATLVTGHEARMLLDGANARLTVAPGAVLHTVVDERESSPSRVLSRVRVETWAQTAGPYDTRYLTQENGGRPWEEANLDGKLQLFDPRRNTIYTGQGPPPYHASRSADGRYRLTTPGARSTTITATQLRMLRSDHATIVLSAHHAQITPFRTIEHPPQNARATALAILRSAHPTVHRTTFQHRPAVEVTGPSGLPNVPENYYIAPGTYAPLGLVLELGGGATQVERFTTFAVLHGNAANVSRLATLEGAHPHALINTSSSAWNAAFQRLLP